jgi:hypothetical protein
MNWFQNGRIVPSLGTLASDNAESDIFALLLAAVDFKKTMV